MNKLNIDILTQFDIDDDFKVYEDFVANVTNPKYIYKNVDKYLGYNIKDYDWFYSKFNNDYKLLLNKIKNKKLPFEYSFGNTVPLAVRLILIYHFDKFFQKLPFKPQISNKLKKTRISHGCYQSTGVNGWFRPKDRTINFIIKKGYLSFYHEYTHFLDYTLGMYVKEEQSTMHSYLSSGVRGELSAIVDKIIKHYQKSKSYKDFVDEMKPSKKFLAYLNEPQEIFARCGSTYFRNYDYYEFNYSVVENKTELVYPNEIKKNKELFTEFINIVEKLAPAKNKIER